MVEQPVRPSRRAVRQPAVAALWRPVRGVAAGRGRADPVDARGNCRGDGRDARPRTGLLVVRRPPLPELSVSDVYDPLAARREFAPGSGRTGYLYSLPDLERSGLGAISRLPVCLRVILESVLRNCDGKR